MNDEIIDFLALPSASNTVETRPQVTLSYAQSVDGSLSLERGKPTPISGPQSLKLTHQLRSKHDAIMIGIGTLLADNPRLNVREVQGNDPQPIVLDSGLRFPPGAKLLEGQIKPWVFYGQEVEPGKKERLEQQGLLLFRAETNADNRINLHDLLVKLKTLKVNRLMLEGGASLIAAFMKEKLLDKAVITISPIFIGGYKVLENALGLPDPSVFPRLSNPQIKKLGDDFVLWGDFS